MRKSRVHSLHEIISYGKRKMQWANFEESKHDQTCSPYPIHIRHKKNKKETYVQKPPGHCVILHTPVYENCLKFLFRDLSIKMVEQYSVMFKNDMFVYFCDLSITELLHRALYETETHNSIWLLCRHQEGPKFPAGPIKLCLKCLVWALIVFIEQRGLHTEENK